MLPDFLTSEFMTDLVREFPVEGSFLGPGILPYKSIAGRKTLWDILLNDAKLAKFIAPGAESPLADKQASKRMFHEIATIRIKERLDEEDVLALRRLGTPDMVMDNLFTQQAAIAQGAIRDTAERMARQVEARVEWMRWQALDGGVVAYDDSRTVFSVDFGIPSGNKATLLTTARWSQTATADPLANLSSWKQTLRKACKRAPAVAYIGANVPGYLAANASIRTLLTGTPQLVNVLNPDTIVNFFGSLVGLDLILYDNTYQDDTGTSQYYLNPDHVIIMPRPVQSDGERLGDIATGPAKANNWMPGRYGWVKEEEDPWVTFVGAGIEAFPRLYHPDWIFRAIVHS